MQGRRGEGRVWGVVFQRTLHLHSKSEEGSFIFWSGRKERVLRSFCDEEKILRGEREELYSRVEGIVEVGGAYFAGVTREARALAARGATTARVHVILSNVFFFCVLFSLQSCRFPCLALVSPERRLLNPVLNTLMKYYYEMT